MTVTTPAVIEGYHLIRSGCALVDRSATTVVRVSGSDAAGLLSRVCSRSVDFLLEGQILSALLTTESGTLVAELLVHCLGSEFRLEVDAERATAVVELLRSAAGDGTTVDTLDDLRVLAIEGPESPAIAQQFVSLRVDSMAYPSFVVETFEGAPLLVSRTGVSGEYGFAFHVGEASAPALLAALERAGAVPVELDALEICRLEMRFPHLSSEAPEPDATPFSVGLQWMVDFAHDFPGKLALLNHGQNERTTAPVCWQADGVRDVPERGSTLVAGGSAVGRVRHALYSPGLDCVIGIADMPLDLAASGLELALPSGAAARTVSAPFRKATSLGRRMINTGGPSGNSA